MHQFSFEKIDSLSRYFIYNMQEKMTGKWILQGTHWQITGRYRNKQTKNKCYAVTLKRTTERTHLKLCSSIISVEHTIQIALRVSWSIWKFAVPLFKKKKFTSATFCKMSLQLFLHNSTGETTFPLINLTHGNSGRV